GTAQIKVSDLLKIGRGAVIELDRAVGDPVDILVNQRKVAVGDIVVVEDRLGVTLTETVKIDKLEKG
ncbi:MAG: FliM/FliN family flagellar motor switch protein, partial [Alphaproteobacteria bacterium]|nr:FliM/FliN family flagellar motor switch protein [Alphaproteobacteria bacterium]